MAEGVPRVEHVVHSCDASESISMSRFTCLPMKYRQFGAVVSVVVISGGNLRDVMCRWMTQELEV